MDIQGWRDFYDIIVTVLKKSREERDKLKLSLFDGKEEPCLGDAEHEISASSYYAFVRDALRVVDGAPEEQAFREAGMGWLHEYHQITKPYLVLQNRVAKEEVLLLLIRDLIDVYKSERVPQDWQIAKVHKLYTELCEAFPDAYRAELYPMKP